MSRFEPVHLPEGRGLNRRASQTLLRHFNQCNRSGYLYQLFKGEARTDRMEAGRGLHEMLRRATAEILEEGEVSVPPELAKAVVDEVLADPDYAIPVEYHDYEREAVYRWASETAVDPSAVVANETLFTVEIASWEVRCRIDFAESLEDGAAVKVVDYKNARGAPSFEDIARKRKEPLAEGGEEARLYAAKNLQLILYSFAIVFGVPVREEPCPRCAAHWIDELAPQGFIDFTQARCQGCNGHGTVEIPEPFPVAGRAQRIDSEFVFPGIETDDGKMLRRPLSLTRMELEGYRPSLEGLIRRLEAAERTGDWPALSSDQACTECPAEQLCPIPRELRDYRGEINTMAQAAEASEKLDRDQAEIRARREEIKRFSQAKGLPVRFGADRVFEFAYQEQTRIIDKDRFLEDVERAARYGEPLDRAKHIKTVKSTPFRVRTLTADELAEEAGEEQ